MLFHINIPGTYNTEIFQTQDTVRISVVLMKLY